MRNLFFALFIGALLGGLLEPLTAKAAHGTAIHFSQPACVKTTIFTVTDPVGVPLALLTKVEAAVQYQVQYQVARFWPVGCVVFGPDGIPLTIIGISGAPVACNGPDSGCHISSTPPSIVVGWDGIADDFSYIFSHEVIETLEDPTLTGTEICDPVSWNEYRDLGVAVADFILPSWVTNGAGPWDYAQALHGSGTHTAQGFIFTLGSGAARSRRHRIKHFHGGQV